MKLLATGFFKEVRFSLKRGSKKGWIKLIIHIKERGTIILNDLYLGITELDTFGGVDISYNNFLGTGYSLGFGFVASNEQQGYRLRFSMPQISTSSFSFHTQLLINNAKDFLGHNPVFEEGSSIPKKYSTVKYLRLGGIIGFGYALSYSTQIYIDYRLERIKAELPTVAAHRRGGIIEPINFHLINEISTLSSFALILIIDTRDELFLPQDGHIIHFSVELASNIWGSNYDYIKFVVKFNKYWKLPWKHIIKLGLFSGLIIGDAPLFEQFYVGDLCELIPSRALELNFTHVPPPDIFNTSIKEMRYEDIAGRLDIEYSIPIYRGGSIVYGIDFFALLGFFALGSVRDFERPPQGYKGFSIFPLDLTFDLGFKFDTLIGSIDLSFQNIIALIPQSEE